MGKQVQKFNPRAKRSKEQRESDLKKVTELYLRGVPYRQIAEILSDGQEYTVSYVQVSHDIKEIVKRWEAERFEMIDKQRLIEIAKINRLEEMYLNAWEESRGKRKKTMTTQSGNVAAPNHVSSTEMEEQSPGDPRFLKGLEWCIEQRCKILGLEIDPAANSGTSDIINPTARTIVFTTHRRKQDEQIQEAEVITDKAEENGV